MDDTGELRADPRFWGWMEQRRQQLHLRPTVLHHDRTRRKARSGELLRGDVYERMDDLLGWIEGDAQRAATEGIPARIRPGFPAQAQYQDQSREESSAALIRTLCNIVALVAESGDSLSLGLRADAKRQLDAIARRIHAEQAAHNM